MHDDIAALIHQRLYMHIGDDIRGRANDQTAYRTLRR